MLQKTAELLTIVKKLFWTYARRVFNVIIRQFRLEKLRIEKRSDKSFREGHALKMKP